ncbi:hypothetical protein [Crenalkalicoccus roseus]|uniref:hypothetical protein n=1 Tax=Crenalkalicoccus roseus TaxID=1485588 RepID=UPI0010804C58|nr:hypothetical protein [Crenalkalicoccus roseus]
MARGGKPSRAPIARLRQVMAAIEERLPEAQERCFGAREAGGARRLAPAGEALALSPADARGVPAPEGSEPALALWQQAVAAGTVAVGPGAFPEDAGDVRGLIETRPRLRARHGLARKLCRHRRHEAAADLRDMRRLNPDDTRGVRYLLMGWPLGRDAEAAALHARYAGDGYAGWPYDAAPLAFRRHGEGAAALARAVGANPHLPPPLTGQAPTPKALPGAYAWGSREEARRVAEAARTAWEATPGPLDWLRRHAPAPPRKGHPHARPGA